MTIIPLTKNKIATVDDYDYPELSQNKWSARQSKKDGKWYAVRRSKGRMIYMHRQIMKTPPELQVDHKDGNGLNCQRYNMRNCTHIQNSWNKQKTKGASIFKGVSWAKRNKKWSAYIAPSGKSICIGHFNSEEEAAKAYDREAVLRFGEFAYLNFPLAGSAV
jgi:hypothetical protein